MKGGGGGGQRADFRGQKIRDTLRYGDTHRVGGGEDGLGPTTWRDTQDIEI